MPTLFAVATLLLTSSGCATYRPASTAQAATFDAQGTFVRHVRVRLRPSHTKAFEALMARCVQAAQAADLSPEHEWLCYRESPGRYWVLWFSEDAEGLFVPEAPDALAGFASFIAGLESDRARNEIDSRLVKLDYDIEWKLVSRQKSEWSTANEMSTATHPKARMMVRFIEPGKEAAFDRALEVRTAFLLEHGYRLPIEGFVTLDGAPGTALQVVFPVDWPSFHSTDSFGEFVRNLDDAAQVIYAQRKEALMATMKRAEFYDADFLPELSFSVED